MMKKYVSIILSIFCILSLIGCSKKDTYEIEILIPAGSTEAFVYADEEICPTGNKITISAGAGIADTEVVLKPVEVKTENTYEPTYLTQGRPVKMEAEKGGWFKIGVAMQNDSEKGPIAVSIKVEGVEVRIPEKIEVTFEAAILEIRDNHYLVEPVEGSQELKSADQITVPIKHLDPSLEPEVGDVIEIIYDGMIAESYPAQIMEVYSIKVIKEAEDDEIILYNGKEYKKSELSDDTLYWLGLSEQEKIASSYLPPEFMVIDEKYGITIEVENITQTGATIRCIQSGGDATGELMTGSWYCIEKWTPENGWEEVKYILQENEIGWNDIGYMISELGTVELEVNWEWLYGELPAGRYRIGKEIMDFRKTGDYDTVVYYGEFRIDEGE